MWTHLLFSDIIKSFNLGMLADCYKAEMFLLNIYGYPITHTYLEVVAYIVVRASLLGWDFWVLIIWDIFQINA